MKVLILYFTKTGHTLEAVTAMAEGIRTAGSEVEVVTAKKFNGAQLGNYDALIVASPCWAGSAGVPVLPKPINKALSAMTAESLQGKRCGAISIHAGVGGENTIKRIGAILTEKGCMDFQTGPVARAGVPFSIIKGPAVSAKDEALFKAFGAEFVQ